MKRFIKTSVFVLMFIIVSIFAITVSAADIYENALPFDKELLYGRNALAEIENGEELIAIYDTVFEGIQAGRTEISFYILNALYDIEVTVPEMQCVIDAVRYDNPQLFYVESLGYSYYPSNQIVPEAIITYIEDVNTDEARAEFAATAEQFIVDAGVREGMSEYEISLLLHDAVVEHVEYVLGADNDHNAYGALIGGKAVCEGYAELYQYLLYLCGIQSHAVTGLAGEAHMWNLVRIDGEYYMSDPTWDDPIGNNTGRIIYEYLNVTTEKMLSEGREFYEIGYDLPTCTSTKANYYNHYFYNMSNFKEQPSVENAITQLKYYGEARFHYNGTGTYSYSEFTKWCSANIGSIVNEVPFVAGTTQISYSCSAINNEYILVVKNVDKMPLPEVANIPKIAAVCVDTGITVRADSYAGDVAICPVVSGKTPSAADIQERLNNTAVEIKDLKDGKVVTGSKLIFENEEAVIALKGDVDNDGVVTVFDANMAQKGDISFQNGMELQKVASDVDGNDTLDKNDSQAIINQIVS